MNLLVSQGAFTPSLFSPLSRTVQTKLIGVKDPISRSVYFTPFNLVLATLESLKIWTEKCRCERTLSPEIALLTEDLPTLPTVVLFNSTPTLLDCVECILIFQLIETGPCLPPK